MCVWGGSASPVGRHGCDGQVRNVAHTRQGLAAAGTRTWTHLLARVALQARVRLQRTCCEQRGSDRKPKVLMLCRSSYSRSLLVVKRSTAMPRSSFLMPHPLSVICTAQRREVTHQRTLGVQPGQQDDLREPTRTAGAPRSPRPRPDLEQLEPAGLGHDGDVGGARVDAVLQQLLERVGRPVDDLLACSRARGRAVTPHRHASTAHTAGGGCGATPRRPRTGPRPSAQAPLARTSPAAIRLTVAWSSRRIVGAST